MDWSDSAARANLGCGSGERIRHDPPGEHARRVRRTVGELRAVLVLGQRLEGDLDDLLHERAAQRRVAAKALVLLRRPPVPTPITHRPRVSRSRVLTASAKFIGFHSAGTATDSTTCAFCSCGARYAPKVNGLP